MEQSRDNIFDYYFMKSSSNQKFFFILQYQTMEQSRDNMFTQIDMRGTTAWDKSGTASWYHCGAMFTPPQDIFMNIAIITKNIKLQILW